MAEDWGYEEIYHGDESMIIEDLQLVDTPVHVGNSWGEFCESDICMLTLFTSFKAVYKQYHFVLDYNFARLD